MVHMKRKDSAKTYGLVGAALIIAAFVLWAFVLPILANNPTPDQDTLDSLTESPTQRQSNPERATGEPAMPSPR